MTVPPSSHVWLCRTCRVLLFGQLLRRRRFPARTLKQSNCVMNGHGKIRCSILSKDCKSNSDYAAGRSEQWAARSALAGARVIDDSLRVEIGDVALRRQRLNVFGLRQITEQGFSRTVPILNSPRFTIIQPSQQPIRSGRISHRHDDLANRYRLRTFVERQHRNLWRQVLRINRTDGPVFAGRCLFVFEWNPLRAAGKESHQLFQTRPACDAAAQTHRPFIRQPRLPDVAIRQNETIAGVKTTTDERILSDLTVAFRSQLKLFSSVLHRVATVCGWKFRKAQRPASSGFDESVRAVDQAHAGSVINAQHFAERQRIENLFVGLDYLAQLLVGFSQLLLLGG